uniref:Uncharacterized protein n=1 Tax=Salix viminalis TaxID=40686 RepID=A0A6N2LDR9_SALVM
MTSVKKRSFLRCKIINIISYILEPRPSTASPLHPGAQLEWLLRLCTPSGNDTKLGQSQISKRERDV